MEECKCTVTKGPLDSEVTVQKCGFHCSKVQRETEKRRRRRRILWRCCSKMQNSCRECKKKCLRGDEKGTCGSFSPISTAPSFFKIMIGDFRKAMFIPPKFARTLGGLVDKNMFLEDSVGNCWMVKLSEIDGSLAFQQGWQDFVLDHSISFGEFVIFKHISVSRYIVQIYGTSGSERLQFQGKENSNNHKRKRSKNEITPDILSLSKAQKSWEASERKHNASDKTSSKKERVEKAFPRHLASSEMAARKGSSEKDRVERTFRRRLASNEMAARICVTRGAREHTYSLEESPPHNDGPVRLHNSSTLNYSKAPCKIIDLCKRVEEAEENSPIILSDDEDSDTMIMTEDDSFLYVDKSKGHSKPSAKELVKNREENLAVDSRATKRCLLATERKSSMVHKDAEHEEEIDKITPVTPETSQSKKNRKGKNISVASEGKMSQHEKEVAVEHIKDRNEDLAACKKSDKIYLLASERNSLVIDENSVCKQEVLEIGPITSVHHETSQTKRSPQDTNKLEVNEETLSHQHSSPKRTETASTADCAKCETRTQFEDSRAIVTHPLANERAPMVGCSQGQNGAAEDQVKNGRIERKNKSETIEVSNKSDDGEFVGKCYERSESATPNCVEYEGRNLIVSEEFASTSLVMGDDICYTADVDSKDKLEVIIDASIGICAANVDCNVLDADKEGATRKSSSRHENSPEIPSNGPILNCNGNEGNPPPSNKGITNYDQSERNSGNHTDLSQAKNAKSSPLVMADISELHKDLTTIKAEPFTSGNKFSGVDAEKVTPCLKEGVLATIKTEIMGSADVMPLNYAEFSITVSLISQSWLLLPERLPARLFKKRCLRKVVLLQDPSMRLWPVLYHESLNFIGFVGGWEDFATTNNLQLGVTCQIESISASEPTFKVQFSDSQNPT